MPRSPNNWCCLVLNRLYILRNSKYRNHFTNLTARTAERQMHWSSSLGILTLLLLPVCGMSVCMDKVWLPTLIYTTFIVYNEWKSFFDKKQLPFKWRLCEFSVTLEFNVFCLPTFYLLPTNNTTLVFLKGSWKFTGKLKAINIFAYCRSIF